MLFDSLITTFEPEDEIRVLSISKRDTRPWQVARVAKHLATEFPPDLNWVKKELARPTRARVIAEIVGRKANIRVLSELHRGALTWSYSPEM